MGQGYFNQDTIAAIATSPMAQSAIGVLRISGAQAWEAASFILRKHTKAREKFSREKLRSHYLQRCLVVDHKEHLLDDAMFVWMKAPNSFTGEEVVEIQMHGNPLTLKTTLHAITESKKARLALPGEFSFRAFRNGKMDLSQAEAVMDLIASKSPMAAESALNALLGSNRTAVDQLKAELIHLLAEIEVDIDFSDQGLSQIDFADWGGRLRDWQSRVEKICDRFQKATPLREGFRVAIVGAPNSGKSTLFNTLLGEDRSIVSDIAGTTRDVVRESFQIAGLLFLLSDTAGLRATTDFVEKEGIARSLGELRGAQIIFLVLDAADKAQGSEIYLEQRLEEIRKENVTAPLLILLNKSDIPGFEPAVFAKKAAEVLPISAKTGRGIVDLENRILSVTRSLHNSEEDSFQIGRMRHHELLGRAAAAVEGALVKLQAGETFPDLLSSDLRQALAALGEITGEVGPDDVLNHIFSAFCIGK